MEDSWDTDKARPTICYIIEVEGEAKASIDYLRNQQVDESSEHELESLFRSMSSPAAKAIYS